MIQGLDWVADIPPEYTPPKYMAVEIAETIREQIATPPLREVVINDYPTFRPRKSPQAGYQYIDHSDPGRIFVVPPYSPMGLLFAVAHEFRHHWQRHCAKRAWDHYCATRWNWWGTYKRYMYNPMEIDANLFALRVTEEVFGPEIRKPRQDTLDLVMLNESLQNLPDDYEDRDWISVPLAVYYDGVTRGELSVSSMRLLGNEGKDGYYGNEISSYYDPIEGRWLRDDPNPRPFRYGEGNFSPASNEIWGRDRNFGDWILAQHR